MFLEVFGEFWRFLDAFYKFLTILKQNKRDFVFHCKFEPLNVFLHRFFSFFIISSHILGFFCSFSDFVNYV